VASFCSKCGAQLSPDAQACTACGAPVAAAPAAAPVQPSATPAKSGNTALKIVLIVVAVFVGLGILGAGAFGYFAWRVAHSIHVSGDRVTLHTPGGNITANASETYTADELGTDIYPGATTAKGGMRMSLPTGSMVTAVYLTPDSKDQVLSFYKGKFGSNASVFETPEASVLTINKGEKESVVVTITKGESENEGKTQISIVHTTANKPS
jgi:zinc-ribbon domain